MFFLFFKIKFALEKKSNCHLIYFKTDKLTVECYQVKSVRSSYRYLNSTESALGLWANVQFIGRKDCGGLKKLGPF